MPSPTPLVGRSAELAELERERKRASAGAFRIVLLLADGGIGKTRLAREFLTRPRLRVTTLAARAYPLSETAAFGVWSEAIESHLHTLDAAEVSRLCGGFLDDLAGLIRSVAAVRGSVPDRDPPRIRVLEGLASLLASLARRTPIVVFLDDAHVADASSWEALDYLARNLAEERVLVVAAARPGELADNPSAARVYLALEQEGLLQRLPLRPLDAEALGSLAEGVIQSLPPRPLVDWLADRSRGNPLFALGLLQSLVDEGADLTAPELRSIPEELAERVGYRMSGLEESELVTLEALATAQARTDIFDLVAFSGLPVDRLTSVLERLARLRLVAEDERGRDLSYELAHPLIQQSVYERIGAARRRTLHRRIARVLQANGRIAEAAPHFARSASVGDDEAIDALRDAIHHAESRQAYREALTILGALVELIPRSDARWLGVLDALSWQAEWVVDHRADAHAVLGIEAMNAIETVLDPSWDAAPRAMVKFRLAHFLAWGSGELERAERACTDARSLFEQAGDRASSLLAENELAWIRGLRGNYAAMQVGGAQVGEAAEAGHDRFAAIQGFHTAGHAAWIRGRFAEGETALRRSNAIASGAGKVYRGTVGLISLATCLALQGRIGEALPLLDEAKAANPGWRDSILPEWESIVHWFAGDFPTAVARAHEAEARTAGELSKRRVIGVLFGALAAVEVDQLGEAQRQLNRARGTLGGREWQFFLDACGHVEALLAWRQRDAPEALVALRERPMRILETGALPFAAIVLLDLAEIAAEAGDAATATDAAGQLGEIAGRVELDLYAGLAAMGSAWAALSRGETDESARRAIDLLADSECRGLRARSLHVLGRTLVATDRDAAIHTLGEAADAFDSCGALWRRDGARDALRGLGAHGRRAAAKGLGPASLSGREREVARLAAGGHTARAIAERLFISERTVESHLAHVYTKLGVGSKLELVRRASEFALNQ
ncbi:MAG: ATP-binding protein [Gaiellaceae bacterium]